MERLTFEGNFCDIAKCEDTPGGSFCEYGYCDQRKVWERLKSIEDVVADENGKYDFEELAALVQAESEGCNHCTHKLQSDAWKYYTYPCSECRRRTKDYFEAAEAALAEKKGR